MSRHDDQVRRVATHRGETRPLDTRWQDASPMAAGDASRLQTRRIGPGALCAWCEQTIPERDADTGRRKRRDAETCSKACRQARHRFRVGPAPAAADRPMRFAYADPPYPGLARRYYGCEEVDHRELVERLVRDYPDGWALSTSAEALQTVLALCPAGIRVHVWVKGARGGKARTALNAYEVVLVYGGRAEPEPVAQDLRDVLLYGGRQHSHPDALVGMKPAAFCEWVFRLLGARQGDELADLFPGSGAIARAWTLYASPTAAGDASSLAGATRRLDALLADGRDASPGPYARRVERDPGDASPLEHATRRLERGATRRGDRRGDASVAADVGGDA